MKAPFERRDVVYFLRNPRSGEVKIGYTGCLRVRLRSLRRIHGRDLKVLATYPGGVKLEGRFHTFLLDMRTEGEWFRADSRIDDLVEAILVGDFDEDCLPAGTNPIRSESARRFHAARRSRLSEAA